MTIFKINKMKIYSLIFAALIFIISCKSTTARKKELKFINSVCKFTKDAFYVYIVIEDSKKQKYLLTTLDLYYNQYNYLDLTTTYIDTLRRVMIREDGCLLEKISNRNAHIIDKSLYESVSKNTAIEVYKTYIDKNGIPKYMNFTKNEITTALAFLVENGFFVTMGQSYEFRVNSL